MQPPTPTPASEPQVDAELLALLEQMRSAAKRDPARQREVSVGEFLVDGARVPLSLVDGLQHLTRTEAAALRFAGWGRSNADIATLLAISEGTARTHLNSAVRKLELDGMRGLVALAGLLFHPLD
ncbi:helix-turn-helix domain-containing protein [Qipengyuania sp. DGS5-3]|uniref:helix-turn-helix domain-containing protein n=1 Tax=Qipengyuania sp. DGS5-3 TaxID=3349632 RepID=UPI0036D3D65C